MEKGIWLEIEELYKEFQQLGISQSVDYEKYYLYSLITPVSYTHLTLPTTIGV